MKAPSDAEILADIDAKVAAIPPDDLKAFALQMQAELEGRGYDPAQDAELALRGLLGYEDAESVACRCNAPSWARKQRQQKRPSCACYYPMRRSTVVCAARSPVCSALSDPSRASAATRIIIWPAKYGKERAPGSASKRPEDRSPTNTKSAIAPCGERGRNTKSWPGSSFDPKTEAHPAS